MTDQYQKRDINNGENFFFHEFAVGDPAQVLGSQSQLASFDTGTAAGTVQLPSARSVGPNAEISILAGNASINPLTIALAAGDSFISSAGITLPNIISDNVVTTFKSNGFDNWIAVSQTT